MKAALDNLSQSVWQDDEWYIPQEMTSRQAGMGDWSSGRELRLNIASDAKAMQDQWRSRQVRSQGEKVFRSQNKPGVCWEQKHSKRKENRPKGKAAGLDKFLGPRQRYKWKGHNSKWDLTSISEKRPLDNFLLYMWYIEVVSLLQETNPP